MKETFSLLAGLLFIIGFVPYISAILQKKTQPSKATWIIWATLDVIVTAGMYATGTLNFQIAGATGSAIVVVVLSLKYGLPDWSAGDKFCLTGAALGILLWVTSGDPLFGIIVSSITVFLGSIPTFVSAWKDPSREDRTGWTFFWVSCVFQMFAVPRWTLADAVQPITFLAVETTMMFILFIRPRLMRRVAAGLDLVR